MNRRDFVSGGGVAAVFCSARPVRSATVPGLATRTRFGCNLYTFDRLLASRAMTLPAVLESCAAMGFDAVDPTGYYFPGYPNVPTDDFVYEIRRLAFRLGLDISGTGVQNDFTRETKADVEADVAHVGRWVEVASKLGAPNLRVFTGKDVPAGPAREAAAARVVASLKACAQKGAARGVMIALQNHHDFVKTSSQVLEVLDAVDSPWLGLNLDVGSLRDGDPYDEIVRLAGRAITWQIKDTMYYGAKAVPTDLKRLARIVKDSRYRGYLPLELLGKEDPRIRLPHFLAEVRAAFA